MFSKRFLPASLVAASGVFVTANFTGCAQDDKSSTPANEAPPIAVRAVPVEWSDRAVPVSADGVVVRKVESALSFKIDGMIQSVDVRAGDPVEAGQTLATLDLAEIDAAVTRARAALDKARRDLGRAQRLESKKVATLEQVEDANTAVELAEAGVRAAEFNQRFATITAPGDGVVLQRLADPDEIVKAGTPIVRFAANDTPWIVRTGLSERELEGIHINSTAHVTLVGHEPLEARVTRIAGMADPTTRTVPVELELLDPPDDLRSGFVASIEIQPHPVARRPVIPLEAIVAGDRLSASVFLASDDSNRARKVSVTLERLHDGKAYLATPLPEHALLITSGAEFLTDGARISVTH